MPGIFSRSRQQLFIMSDDTTKPADSSSPGQASIAKPFLSKFLQDGKG